ncbi:MAG TPA: SDR family oxidoreductase [Bacteroidales bacterium]
MLLKNKPTIALTGATGFLGSHLMASLLTKNYNIIVLGRSAKNEPLNERITRLLRWFGMENCSGQVTCIDTDLSQDKLGIENGEYSRICSVVGSVIHCASDTSFSENKREKVMSANINNLKGILEFSKNANISFFHYISTAYVAGTGVTYCKEVLSSAKTFTNVYEESKAAAENIISDFCHKNSINLSIIRPSIVYGDSQNGRSLKFNALYFPIRAAQSIRDLYLNDLNNNGGIKAAKNGVYIDKDGYLFLPLKIFLPREGDLNIIPVDYFVNATVKIIENCSGSGIYHLTSNSPITMKIIAEYYQQLMKVKGVEIIYGLQPDNLLRNPAEELFDRFIEPYRPYLSDDRVFDRKNSIKATEGLNPPVFTYEVFKTCMEYAIEVNWGASIFD